MKKKIVSLALAVCLIAIAAVGTLAYFTDKDAKTNTFTVGNVAIELLESKLHRENAGVPNDQTSTSELWSNVDMEGANNTSPYKTHDAFYTDAQIEADAAAYSCEGVKLNPGQSYHKMPYVKNTGSNDAYIRIRVMFPADLVNLLNSSMYTSSCLSNKEFTMTEGEVERDGIKYVVCTFTRIDPLKSGEMTYWNVWGTVHMDKDVTNENIAALFGEGKAYADGTFPVLVEADAIQADGFANADAAFAAFDAA